MPTAPRAPRLRGEPGDAPSTRVVLLLRQVLVAQHALGVAAAAHVDAHAGVAVSGEQGGAGRRARASRRACGTGCTRGWRAPDPLGVLRQPHARRQADAVAHRNPDVAHDADRLRQLLDALHPAPILAGGAGGCTAPASRAAAACARRGLRSPAPRGTRLRIASSTRRGARGRRRSLAPESSAREARARCRRQACAARHGRRRGPRRTSGCRRRCARDAPHPSSIATRRWPSTSRTPSRASRRSASMPTVDGPSAPRAPGRVRRA